MDNEKIVIVQKYPAVSGVGGEIFLVQERISGLG
jgi:hypothetical protein